MDPLAPFEPSPAEPWDRRRAAHLLRRAGFGASAEETAAAVRAGPDRAVTALFEDSEDVEHSAALALADTVAARKDVADLQAWWLLRMVRARRPLREKLALFWHGHFATSATKVGDLRLLARQNRLFLEHGPGPFEVLLQAAVRDPALLLYLDSNANRRGHPNENFARELMELFTLGLGGYGERDVQEAARACTGWHVRDGAFRFDAALHDAGSKTVLGASGPWTGGDVARLSAGRPECARFIARKLFGFFAREEPEPPLVDALAERFRAEGLHVGRFLRALFRSRAFYDPRALGTRVKGPVELVVELVRLTGARPDFRALARATGAMGQSLFQPPTVKGWDGGRRWLSGAALLARLSFLARLAAAPGWDAPLARRIDAAERPEEAVGEALEATVDQTVPEGARRRLVELARLLGPGERARGLFRALGALPELHVG
jgi:uncharacterized protein (DUF1800 family)